MADINIQEQIIKYQNISLKFIENNKPDLISIYLQHSKTDGEGVLAINFAYIEEKKNVDVSYIPLTVLPEDLVKKVNERKLVNNENIIYFLIATKYDENIVELDIRDLIK